MRRGARVQGREDLCRFGTRRQGKLQERRIQWDCWSQRPHRRCFNMVNAHLPFANAWISAAAGFKSEWFSHTEQKEVSLPCLHQCERFISSLVCACSEVFLCCWEYRAGFLQLVGSGWKAERLHATKPALVAYHPSSSCMFLIWPSLQNVQLLLLFLLHTFPQLFQEYPASLQPREFVWSPQISLVRRWGMPCSPLWGAEPC